MSASTIEVSFDRQSRNGKATIWPVAGSTASVLAVVRRWARQSEHPRDDSLRLGDRGAPQFRKQRAQSAAAAQILADGLGLGDYHVIANRSENDSRRLTMRERT
jgi:hypothetical protein